MAIICLQIKKQERSDMVDTKQKYPLYEYQEENGLEIDLMTEFFKMALEENLNPLKITCETWQVTYKEGQRPVREIHISYEY
jgi:hypothetical protein